MRSRDVIGEVPTPSVDVSCLFLGTLYTPPETSSWLPAVDQLLSEIKMGNPKSAPLNAETSQPGERSKHHLAPKSYVDAVEEEPPVNSSNGTNGISNGSHDDTSATTPASKPSQHTASVLRIVDTGADAKETRENQAEKRPLFERGESTHEYTAAV